MKKILVLGAGKSATTLISYLLQHAEQYDWHIIVGDYNKATAERKVGGHARGMAVFFDVNDVSLRHQYIADCDLVASVLPATFHHIVAKDCLKFGKHIITPSYLSDAHRAMDADFKAAGLLFMGEIGLDPGIDHMSLMQMIGEVREKGANIKEVRSFCGALIAPESDTNPWHYKFTWAPMNVVLSGQGTAQYLKNGRPRYIPYSRLFKLTEVYDIEGIGQYEAYANRNSVQYIDKYQIPDVPTFVRGTLRGEGYCAAWNALVQLGLTDNNITIDTNNLSYSDFVEAFMPPKSAGDERSLRARLARFMEVSETSALMQRLHWLGLFGNEIIGLGTLTPARVLLHLLTKKWALQADDKDMIIMLHKVDYELNGENHAYTSTLVMKGNNANDTALASTVGLPMAMIIKLVLTKQIELTGVHMPIMPQVYLPILEELKMYGVNFIEKDVII